MKISEIIINEAISLSQHVIPIQQSINEGIKTVIYNLSEDIVKDSRFDDLRNSDENTVSKEFNKSVSEYLEIYLRPYIEYSVSHKVRDIIGVGSPGKWVNVSFKDTGSNLGMAYLDNTIGISETKYFDNLVKIISEGLYHMMLDNYIGNNKFVESLVYFLEKSKKYYRDYYNILGIDGTELIKKMSSTIIHEMVHVVQNMKQFKKGRTSTQYRSYLQKSKQEFNKEYDTGSYRWFQLHAGSPQEIAAFIHNIALEIIDDFNLDDFNDIDELKSISLSDILHYVKDFIVIRIGTPKTPVQMKIFKRYLKGVYLEVENYRNYLIDKLKKDQENSNNL